LTALKSFLQSGGGFSFWPGDNTISDWGSSYAGHFLLEAEKKRLCSACRLKSGWLKYQKKSGTSMEKQNLRQSL